jgi:hypothetical protein
MLFSETHFIQNSYMRIPHYTIYHTSHPAGTARGGIAIIIKNTIKHYPLPNYSRDYLQAPSVSVEDSAGHLTITAVYLPPRHTVCKAQLEDFYNTLSPWFIAGGDYNAKHTDWGSRLITLRGREDVKYLGLHIDRRLTRQNTFSPRGNNSALPSPKCIGCSDISPNSPPPTNYSSTKQYSNPSGPTV